MWNGLFLAGCLLGHLGVQTEWQDPVSDALLIEPKQFDVDLPVPVEVDDVAPVEEERPPVCPRCHKRLVILSTQWLRGRDGKSTRRQLWGCPRGHATAHRANGVFTPIEMLPDVVG